MATQTLEFSAGTGLTLLCKLFAVGSDAIVGTQVATEKSNDKNRYSVAFTNVPAGAYRLNAFVDTTGGFANEVYDLTLTTATFQPRSEAPGVTAAEVADAVWDEPYSQHKTAGTFGKLMDTIRKSNLSIDGEVTSAITPTTLTFASNVSATSSAYAHAVLLFVSGPLEGENSPIISYNSTNGVFLLEEELTEAPSAGDEFVVIAGSHVHSVVDIQAGLATSAAVAAVQSTADDILEDTGTSLPNSITNLQNNAPTEAF